MSLTQVFVVLAILLPLWLTTRRRLRSDQSALLIAALLGVGQWIGLGILGEPNTPQEAVKSIAGLSQPVIVTLISLFVVTQALDKTGVTRWLAQHVVTIGGKAEAKLIFLFTVTAALLSLFLNNLAAGALLLPSAINVSRRTGIRPSKLLIPISFGTVLGGSATYFTTANIIANDLLTGHHPAQAPLRILDFTPTGGLIALAGILFLVTVGRRILPNHVPRPEQMIARQTGSELEAFYKLDTQLWEATVSSNSAWHNKTLAATGIGDQLGITVAAIWRGRQALFTPSPSEVIQSGDILLIVGHSERVLQLEQLGLTVGRNKPNGAISKQGVKFIEIVLAPRSLSVGQSLKQLEFRKQYSFTAVALLRERYVYTTDIADMRLRPGDSILMVGERSRLRYLQANPDFIVLEPDISDQPIDRPRAIATGTIVVAAVLASALGVPTFLSMLCAALCVLLLGYVTIEESYRNMEWPAIFLIAGMYAVSQATVHAGIADRIGQGVLALVAPFGSLGLAGGVYLLAALLTQVMGGQVAMLVAGPVAINAALRMGVSPQAIAVATALGCSATFLTPLSHPVNVLMMEPGNYSFGDFFRLGWPLTLIAFAMMLFGMHLFWGL
jgi:di/tricarboxylate transporter